MQEKCGVYGVFNHPKAAEITYYGLHALLLRGQESTRFVASEGNHSGLTGMGLVTQVFSRDILEGLSGNMTIGHIQYSASGENLLQRHTPLVATGTLLLIMATS